MTKRGPEIPIFLERFRGRRFEHAEYSERRFFQPCERCNVCFRLISERPYAEAMRAGMVSLFVIHYPTGTSWSQWEWVCEICYAEFAEVAEWSLLPDGEPIGEESLPAGGRALPDGTEREFVVRWSAEDVAGLAKCLGITLSEDECQRFFEKHSRRFRAKMAANGSMILTGLLAIEYPTPR